MTTKIKIKNGSLEKGIRRRNKSAVLHNGSFITEAFPVKTPETYEDVEGISIDGCLNYPVYTGSHADEAATMTLENGVSQAVELSSVEHLFSLCSDDGKTSQHLPSDTERGPKEVQLLAYESDNSIVVESVPIAVVSSATTTSDSSHYSNEPSQCDHLDIPKDIEAEPTAINNGCEVYSKVAVTSSSMQIFPTSQFLWKSDPLPTNSLKELEEPSLSTITVCESVTQSDTATSLATSIAPEHCVVDYADPADSDVSRNIIGEACKTITGSRQVTSVADLLRLRSSSHIETSKIHHEQPLQIINAVTTADGTIELVDNNGR